MRTEEEVKEAIKDYTRIPFTKFCEKYRVDTVKEAVGFVKALRWWLELA